MDIDLIKISQIDDQALDFRTVVFRALVPRRINMETTRENWILLKSLIDGGALNLFLDFKENDLVDSSGISVIVRASKLISAKGGRIAAANINSEMSVVFRMVNISSLMDIYATETDALDSFRKQDNS